MRGAPEGNKRSGPLFLTVVLSCAIAAAAGSANAGYVEHTVRFDESDLAVERIDGYDHITLPGCDLTRDVGLPQLPVLPLTIALPHGARVTDLEVVTAESAELLGRFRPCPAQRPRILPVPGIDLPVPAPAPPDPSVYAGSRPFPQSIADIVSTGHLGTVELVGVRVNPLQYVPADEKLRLYRTIVMRVHFDLEQGEPYRFDDTRSQRKVLRALSASEPPAASRSAGARRRESALTPGDYEHVIVVGNNSFVEALQPLAEWKTRKGVPSTIVLMTWIDVTYPGADSAERLRNFIDDANGTWGATWFLLAGDTQWVPTRRAYAMTCEAGGHPDEDSIGCDMYFSDLDGSWNADGDGVYGELTDQVDLCPDVFVGRAPIRTLEDADAFVGKVLDYEKATLDDYQLDMLMAAEVLWEDPFTDSGIGLNRIDMESVPPRYDPITKLYETLGNESAESVKLAINQGTGHFLHSGHAWYSVMGCGDGTLYRWDVPELTNDGREPIVYSIGCWPAAFDLTEDCIAERFLQNPHGGAVAFIGNSRYGWASPGNPGYGYSERFMQRFYGALFTDRILNLGAALATAKAAYVPLSQAENVYRWHQYELNLLGDPETPAWTNAPAILSVAHPDSVVPGASVLSVSVRSSSGPVVNALVCAMNGGDVYERGLTGTDGTVSLSVNTVSPESLHITVTADNCRPYESSIPVQFSGAFMRVVETEIDDGATNGDGIANPGETVSLTLMVHNFGSDEAPEVSVSIDSSDPLIDVEGGGEAYCGDIPGGATAVASPAVSVAVAGACPDRHVAVLNATIVSGSGRSVWTGTVSFTVGAPVLAPASYAVDDTEGGDGDGFAEPGETVKLMIEVTNSGLAAALASDLELVTASPSIEVTEATAAIAGIPPGARRQALFEIRVGSACPQPSFPELTLEATTLDGLVFTEQLLLAVGNAGFAHDFESGESGWVHGGATDAWSLTDNRSHSGAQSWYVGIPGEWVYSDNENSYLDSPLFVRGENAELSFWCWYEFPIYHEDGFYVEVLSPGAVVVDTLDFIGSGGALDFLGSIGNDWLEYRYRLPGEVGDSLAIRFVFVSDADDVAEGVYVDDVSIRGTAFPTDTGSESDEELSSVIALRQNSPNPFRSSTRLSFETLVPGNVTLSVYNVQGRLIRTLASGFAGAGSHESFWDGTDEFGTEVAGGVYLYRLTLGEDEQTRKMILLR
ncbi:MAG: T9SS type A sorting domain-containing protein [Candidatus Eisenbacteria bacterium]|nr:T9SS type A sorting domain-containing protein [Candidatus Eisenbacteria bacterium]